MHIFGMPGCKSGPSGTPTDPITVTLDPNILPLTVVIDPNAPPITVNVQNTVDSPLHVSLESLPRHIVQYCLDGAYDGQEALIYMYSDGSFEYCLKSGGTLLPVPDPKLLECTFLTEEESKKVYWEIVRLDGDLLVDAIPFVPAVGAGTTIPHSPGAPGTKFKLTGEYKSWQTRWLRETVEGSQFEVTIDGQTDGVGYVAGSGCLYVQDLLGFHTDHKEVYCQDIWFEAKPGAYVELLITRWV